MFSRARVAPVLAEFLGTATLASVAIVLTETTGVSYFIGTSLALTLAAVYLFFSSVSGAHFNPAITFGMWAARRLGTLRAISYVAAQMLGGMVAWQLYEYLTDRPLAAKEVTFTAPIWVAEAVGTFILALGFTAAVSKVADNLQSAISYALSIFAGIMVASIASAGILNPALALGLRNWGTVYILGPLVGGLLGVTLYTYLFAPETAPRVSLRVSRRKK
jgi:glycerol uptake facilitator-like aquaporin